MKEKEKFKITNVLKAIGSGFISGAADDDLTAIAVYTPVKYLRFELSTYGNSYN